MVVQSFRRTALSGPYPSWARRVYGLEEDGFNDEGPKSTPSTRDESLFLVGTSGVGDGELRLYTYSEGVSVGPFGLIREEWVFVTQLNTLCGMASDRWLWDQV